jgi:hypothetical protein
MAKPSKNLIGRRVRCVQSNYPAWPPEMEGTVSEVSPSGRLIVEWEDGVTRDMCWDDGDRWTVLPQ